VSKGDPILSKSFYFANATRQSAEQMLATEPFKVVIVRPSTQVRCRPLRRPRAPAHALTAAVDLAPKANSLSISWADPDRVRHSLVERAGATLKTRVDDGSVLYFDTIEALLEHLKLVPFGSLAHHALRQPPAPAKHHQHQHQHQQQHQQQQQQPQSTDGGGVFASIPVMRGVPVPIAVSPSAAADASEQSSASTPSTVSFSGYAAPPEFSNYTMPPENLAEMVNERRLSAANSPAVARKSPAVTREQAQAAGYSLPPDNLKEIRDKKAAERVSKLQASSDASVTRAPLRQQSFEDTGAVLDADGSDGSSSSSSDSDDSDGGRDDSRAKSPLHARAVTALQSMGATGSGTTATGSSTTTTGSGTEDLFESFAKRYANMPRLAELSADDDVMTAEQLDNSGDADDSSVDSSLPPYVVPQSRSRIAAAPESPAVPPAAVVVPLETQLEQVVERLVTECADIAALETVRALLLQSLRRVNARVDDLLVARSPSQSPVTTPAVSVRGGDSEKSKKGKHHSSSKSKSKGKKDHRK
jgi:hypothetical protein